MTYDLGSQFKIDEKNTKAKEECIVLGGCYRITILTERLVRLEYNKEGIFEDRPTQLVLFRNFEKPEFTIQQDDKYLEIATKYFRLEYKKGKSFYSGRMTAGNNLKITLVNTDKEWYFGHVEARNYYASSMSLDNTENKAKLKKGLYSSDGFASIDDSKTLVMDEGGMFIPRENKDSIDTYVFLYRKEFGKCLEDYFTLTGKPPMIPRYALGNWWSKNEKYDSEDIKNLVEKFKRYDLPISVLAMSNYWHIRTLDGKEHKSGYTFNKQLFPAPFDLINYLHKNNIYLGLKTDPSEGILPYEEMYTKALNYFDVEDKNKIPFNPMDPRFLDIYLKLMIHPNEMLGADFWWIDYLDKKNINNLFMLNHYHFWDMNRMLKKRSLILSRNSMIAPHRYPVHYSGKIKVSWDTLSMLPYYNANASNIGMVWWSHDIGGTYGGIEDNELYSRFVQLGCFSPIFRFYGEKGKYYKREPWRWGIRTLEITKKYMKLRHKLIPYIYSEAYNYHKVGTPIFQPLYYYNPEMYDDTNFRKEYYFGSELLVAPIIDKKNEIMDRTVHKFFLPKGMWYDYITGKKFPGDRECVTFFKDEDYPVFARAGAIIPMSLDEGTDTPVNMEIQIFPGVSNEYKLYEDDGTTNSYKKGLHLLTSIDYNYMKSNYTVVIRPIAGKKGIVVEKRNYKIRFRNTKFADTVIANIKDKVVATNNYVDGPDFVVEIKDVPTIEQLTINCKGENIEIDAVRIINEDIDDIISDIAIETELKEKIAAILFGDETIKKKRIAIRRLNKVGLDKHVIKVFINLLEYVEQV